MLSIDKKFFLLLIQIQLLFLITFHSITVSKTDFKKEIQFKRLSS